MSRTFLLILAAACVCILGCGMSAFYGLRGLSILSALIGAALGLLALLIALAEPKSDKRW